MTSHLPITLREIHWSDTSATMCLRVVYQASAIVILQKAVATNPEENTSWSPRAQTPETDRVTGHADFDEAKIFPSRFRHELFCVAAELTTDVICSLLNLNQPPVSLEVSAYGISVQTVVSSWMMEAEIGAPREAAFFRPPYAQDLGLSTKRIRAS
ncbi:hypothetical protein BDR06DRAFT_999073 [Suillus hirtellus]|nr:hypothetical protein BDR06DRAFT_999073 [Suillus hirtellus]